MEFTKDTKIKEIMEAFPELTKELLQDERIAALAASPLAKLMLKTATIQDASKFSGKSVEELIEKLNQMTGQQ